MIDYYYLLTTTCIRTKMRLTAPKFSCSLETWNLRPAETAHGRRPKLIDDRYFCPAAPHAEPQRIGSLTYRVLLTLTSRLSTKFLCSVKQQIEVADRDAHGTSVSL